MAIFQQAAAQILREKERIDFALDAFEFLDRLASILLF